MRSNAECNAVFQLRTDAYRTAVKKQISSGKEIVAAANMFSLLRGYGQCELCLDLNVIPPCSALRSYRLRALMKENRKRRA